MTLPLAMLSVVEVPLGGRTLLPDVPTECVEVTRPDGAPALRRPPEHRSPHGTFMQDVVVVDREGSWQVRLADGAACAVPSWSGALELRVTPASRTSPGWSGPQHPEDTAHAEPDDWVLPGSRPRLVDLGWQGVPSAVVALGRDPDPSATDELIALRDHPRADIAGPAADAVRARLPHLGPSPWTDQTSATGHRDTGRAVMAGDWEVWLPDLAWRTSDCLQVVLEVVNRADAPQSLGTGRGSVTAVTLDGAPIPWAPGGCGVPADERVELGPGGRATVTVGWGRAACGRAGEAVLEVRHVELGVLRIPLEVTLDPASTPTACARRNPVSRDFDPSPWRVPDGCGPFTHPSFADGLGDLARQGVPWAAAALHELAVDDPSLDPLVAELGQHPLPAIREVAVPIDRAAPASDRLLQMAGEHGLTGLSDRALVRRSRSPDGEVRVYAARLLARAHQGDPDWMVQAARRGRPDVRQVFLRALDPAHPPERAVLMEATSSCRHPGPFASASRALILAGHGADVFPSALRCLGTRSDRAARRALLHLVGWSAGAVGCVGPVHAPDVREAWSRVLDAHGAAIEAGHQLPTRADGVPEAVWLLDCAAVPSSRR